MKKLLIGLLVTARLFAGPLCAMDLNLEKEEEDPIKVSVGWEEPKEDIIEENETRGKIKAKRGFLAWAKRVAPVAVLAVVGIVLVWNGSVASCEHLEIMEDSAFCDVVGHGVRLLEKAGLSFITLVPTFKTLTRFCNHGGCLIKSPAEFDQCGILQKDFWEQQPLRELIKDMQNELYGPLQKDQCGPWERKASEREAWEQWEQKLQNPEMCDVPKNGTNSTTEALGNQWLPTENDTVAEALDILKKYCPKNETEKICKVYSKYIINK